MGALLVQEITDQVLTFLVAGHETTSNALSWAFFLLSNHPDAAAKLRDEVVRVLTSGGGVFPHNVARQT